MFSFSILSFILSTVCVMALAYVIVSKMKKSNSPVEEYFTAGRSLSWPIIGGSLLLTNISTEQLRSEVLMATREHTFTQEATANKGSGMSLMQERDHWKREAQTLQLEILRLKDLTRRQQGG